MKHFMLKFDSFVFF
jgi:hypothetical protein